MVRGRLDRRSAMSVARSVLGCERVDGILETERTRNVGSCIVCPSAANRTSGRHDPMTHGIAASYCRCDPGVCMPLHKVYSMGHRSHTGGFKVAWVADLVSGCLLPPTNRRVVNRMMVMIGTFTGHLVCCIVCQSVVGRMDMSWLGVWGMSSGTSRDTT